MRFRALLAALMICACTKVQDKVRTVRVVVSVSCLITDSVAAPMATSSSAAAFGSIVACAASRRALRIPTLSSA